jgi:tryptophan synthase alpha chain
MTLVAVRNRLSSPPVSKTIQETFENLKRRKRIGLVPFVPAGYPDISATGPTLIACDQAGASVIEIGFPFSDPIADGPVIQAAFTKALAKKIKVADVFAAVKAVRGQITAPLAAMISYSIVFRYGIDRFLADAKAAGFDGLILPDLPPPEAEAVCKRVQAAGLQTILLIAPTTAAERRKEIVRLCSGFVYYLSVSGITGERDGLPADLATNVAEIKKLTDRPVCIGFGIHRAAQIEQLSHIADGAIVGTAIVRKMKENAGKGAAAIATGVGDYLREILPN